MSLMFSLGLNLGAGIRAIVAAISRTFDTTARKFDDTTATFDRNN